jgi:hypothetical protein
MSIRTTNGEVIAIVEVDSDISLAPFIAVASALVDAISVLSNSPGYSRLVLIETWLSAHFYCQRDVRSTAETAGPVSQTLESVIDLGFNNTRYGQMAMLLDTSGYLKSLLSGRFRASVMWLGKTEREALTGISTIQALPSLSSALPESIFDGESTRWRNGRFEWYFPDGIWRVFVPEILDGVPTYSWLDVTT